MQTEIFDNLVTRISRISSVPIIAVSGFYGAGKTKFCQAFSSYLQAKNINPIHIPTDMYFRHARTKREELLANFRKQNEYELRKAEAYELDTQLMLAHLTLIKQRQQVRATGLYRRETGNKDFQVNFTPSENSCVLYDGIWVLDKPLRKFYDMVLLLKAEREVRMQRTIQRAQQQIKPYLVTAELFDDIDNFTTEYLTKNLNENDIIIDTSDYRNPSISLP